MGAQVVAAGGWQAIPWQAIAVVVASVVTGGVGIVGIVVSQGARTRERIDALSASLGARVDGLRAELDCTRRDVALLGQRVGTIPARTVDEEDCRERHDAVDRRLNDLRGEVLALSHGRRLIVTGSGGQQ